MKKSELFRLAQMSVLRDHHLCEEQKLNVIKLLAGEENIATIMEKDEEQGDGKLGEFFEKACEDNGGV